MGTVPHALAVGSKKTRLSTRTDLVEEWSPENLKQPDNLLIGSNYKATWVCKADRRHVWKAVVHSRSVRGAGCPFCSGRRVLSGVNDIVVTHPMIASEWSPDNPRKAKEFSRASGYKATWVCKAYARHVWEATVANRVKSRGCHYCSGSRVMAGFNDLPTTHPELAAQWAPQNSGNPQEYSHGSGYKATWVCPVGNDHVWTAAILGRSRGSGCPYCACQKVLLGFNDLPTTNPELASQWSPENERMASEVTAGSGQDAKWICSLDASHKWTARIVHRRNGSGCPFCSSYSVLKGFNDIATLKPEWADEWDHEANFPLTPDEVQPESNKMVHWVCLAGSHRWSVNPNNRNGCPYCAGQRAIVGVNDLATTHPEVAARWHPSNEKLSSDVMRGSAFKALWICMNDKNHVYASSVAKATRGRGCPICANRQIVAGENDLATTHPKFVHQWHPDKNSLSPRQVSAGSSRYAWWTCPEGHEWESQIASRTFTDSACPHCIQWGTSKVEIKLRDELSVCGWIETSVEKRVSLNWNGKKSALVDVLGTLPCGDKIVIEYDGWYWHQNKHEHDTSKTLSLLDAGYIVVRIRENDLAHLELSHANFYQTSHVFQRQRGGAQDMSLVVDFIHSEIAAHHDGSRREQDTPSTV